MNVLTDTHSMSTDCETTKVYIVKSHMMWHGEEYERSMC